MVRTSSRLSATPEKRPATNSTVLTDAHGGVRAIRLDVGDSAHEALVHGFRSTEPNDDQIRLWTEGFSRPTPSRAQIDAGWAAAPWSEDRITDVAQFIAGQPQTVKEAMRNMFGGSLYMYGATYVCEEARWRAGKRHHVVTPLPPHNDIGGPDGDGLVSMGLFMNVEPGGLMRTFISGVPGSERTVGPDRSSYECIETKAYIFDTSAWHHVEAQNLRLPESAAGRTAWLKNKVFIALAPAKTPAEARDGGARHHYVKGGPLARLRICKRRRGVGWVVELVE